MVATAHSSGLQDFLGPHWWLRVESLSLQVKCLILSSNSICIDSHTKSEGPPWAGISPPVSQQNKLPTCASEHTRCRCKRFTGEVWHKCPVPPQILPCKGTTTLHQLLSCYEALRCTGVAFSKKMFLLTGLKSLLRISTQISELVQPPLLSHIT